MAVVTWLVCLQQFWAMVALRLISRKKTTKYISILNYVSKPTRIIPMTGLIEAQRIPSLSISKTIKYWQESKKIWNSLLTYKTAVWLVSHMLRQARSLEVSYGIGRDRLQVRVTIIRTFLCNQSDWKQEICDRKARRKWFLWVAFTEFIRYWTCTRSWSM